ncbi:MAG: Bpu10I family restriction endonuclease [Flavobacteriales bacterium]|nr:Bpu10I family restriction endonuclease [Flavobacteriales bacterium]MCC6939283.1 Bpu10I family restriction endonuclease [Flavobacteriales bacterium]
MYVHGDNIASKESAGEKYKDAKSKGYLAEIRSKYDLWKTANTKLIGPTKETKKGDPAIIAKRVQLFNEYKEFIDQQKFAEHFDSRSNLHSSVLEEFIFYLFRDLVKSFSTNALLGKAQTFKDIFFHAASYSDMVKKPSTRIERKDHDFVIGINVHSKMHCAGEDAEEIDIFQVPAVAIECKTYLDKTMLEGASTSAEQLRHKSPNAMYILVAEWLKLTDNINIAKYRVNQIYVLRKQKNTDREFRYLKGYKKNPVYPDVIEHLFTSVRNHLTADWETGTVNGLSRGWLL